MTSGIDDGNEFGGLGAPMEPPEFDASEIAGNDPPAFDVDLPPEEPAPTMAPNGEFRPADTGARRRGAVMELPVDIVVSVGRARPTLTELVEFRRDSVLQLESRIDDPVELIVGDKVIARGELQEIDPDSGRLGVRLTEVADPKEGP